jgi:hypothetical protein
MQIVAGPDGSAIVSTPPGESGTVVLSLSGAPQIDGDGFTDAFVRLSPRLVKGLIEGLSMAAAVAQEHQDRERPSSPFFPTAAAAADP